MKKIYKTLIGYRLKTTIVILTFLLAGFGGFAQTNPDLENVLEELNENYTSVNSLIPNRFDFEEAETGYYIYSGGTSYMYWYGNKVSTNIGDYVYYSDNVINTSTYFGGEGKYFTRKFQGLFVLAANLENVGNFNITGDLEAYGADVDGTELISGIYKGFVKRVYDSNYNGPSINHLMIVKDGPAIEQSYSSSYYSDDHTISNLNNTDRIYYLLYSSQDGYYINNDETQQIMDAFVALLKTDSIPPNPVSNLMVSDILNSSALASWTAPSDDSLTEPVSSYDIRLDDQPIVSANFNDAPVYPNEITPAPPGSPESLPIDGLTGETQYWIGIKSVDEGGNSSTAVFTSFTTGSDPSISVSVEGLEFEMAVGENASGNFNISNTQAGASPLSFSIDVDSPPINDFLTYVTADYNKVVEVDLLSSHKEGINLSFQASKVDYARSSGDVWASSTSYDKIAVFSAKDHNIKKELAPGNLFKVCIPKYQANAYLIISSNQMSVQVYNTDNITLANSFSLPVPYLPDDVQITADGSKLCVLDYYNFDIFDATTGQAINEFNLDYSTYSFLISDDGNYAYCYSPYNGYVVKLNLANGNQTIKAINLEISTMALSPDGQKLFVGCVSYTPAIEVINTQTMEITTTLYKNDDNSIYDLHVSEDGKKLHCLSRYPANIITFDLATSQIIGSCSIGNNTRSFTFPGGFDDYLTVSPTEGILDANQEQEIEINIAGEGLLPGIYNSNIYIQSNDPDTPIITVPIIISAQDITGPDFNITFFQNHYLTSNLKVLVFAHEDLPESPTLSAGSENLEVEILDSLNYIYNSGYKLTTTENITFTVTGQDSVGNTSTFERVLSSTLTLKNTAIAANYPDNEVNVDFGPGTFNNDVYVTIWKEFINDETIYHIGPEALGLNNTASLSISYGGESTNVSNPEHLSVYIMDNEMDIWIKTTSTINREKKTVKAEINRLGTFKIGYDENSISYDEGPESSFTRSVEVTPNPFTNQTKLTYNNPREGFVQITIHDYAGNLISTPVSEVQSKGSHSFLFNGTDLRNGVYICRINTSGYETVKKLIRIE